VFSKKNHPSGSSPLAIYEYMSSQLIIVDFPGAGSAK